jgi:hypothetical protein
MGSRARSKNVRQGPIRSGEGNAPPGSGMLMDRWDIPNEAALCCRVINHGGNKVAPVEPP